MVGSGGCKRDGDSSKTLSFTALWSAGIQLLLKGERHEWMYFGSRTDAHSQLCQAPLRGQCVFPLQRPWRSVLQEVCMTCTYAQFSFDRHPRERPHLNPCCLGANLSPRLEITTSLAHISMSLLTFPRRPIVPMHACVKKSCECGKCAKLAHLTI